MWDTGTQDDHHYQYKVKVNYTSYLENEVDSSPSKAIQQKPLTD